jgi:signal transduction histidine kinase
VIPFAPPEATSDRQRRFTFAQTMATIAGAKLADVLDRACGPAFFVMTSLRANLMTNVCNLDPVLDDWQHRAFPEAAEALKARAGRIVERWLNAVCIALPHAEELTLAQLRDHIPLILEQMYRVLASASAEPAKRLDEISKPHGDLRFHQNYDVNELMIEYHLLRRIVLLEIGDELKRDLGIHEVAAIGVCLDTAQRRGVVTFVDHVTGQLRSADELQSNYISYLNHDLRGGMNGILLMVEVLKRELAGDPKFAETTEDLEAMRRSVLDSVATMDRFVFAHRLGRGKHEAKFQPMSLKSVVNDVVTNLKSAASERGTELTVDIDKDCTLDSDRDLVRFILQNVVANAIKHGVRKGGRVKITAKGSNGEHACHFSVSDNGPGIAAEDLQKIWNANPGGRGKQGVKLGLPVSKLAAELIGASVRAESTVGVGTTMYFDVPARGMKPAGLTPE